MNDSKPAKAAKAAAARPLFFKQIEVLDTKKHADLHLLPRTDWAFARGSNALPLTFSEIPLAAQEYPIVFAGYGDTLHLVAMVGLTSGDNLFIGADGQWQGRYVPAYLRCYPFALGRASATADDKMLVAIDAAADTFSRSEGQPLFEAEGGQSNLLKQMIGFLRAYDRQMELARTFARRMAELNLLVSVNADVRLKDGRKFELAGLRVVDRKALSALPDAVKLELFNSEWLEMLYHHFASLQTLSVLVDRLAGRPDTAKAA